MREIDVVNDCEVLVVEELHVELEVAEVEIVEVEVDVFVIVMDVDVVATLLLFPDQ